MFSKKVLRATFIGAFVILMGLLKWAGPSSHQPATAAAAVPNPVQLIQVDDQQIIVELTTPPAALTTEKHNQTTYTWPQLVGADPYQQPGYPQIPVYNLFLGIPGSAAPVLQIISGETASVPLPHPLPPSPIPAAIDEDLQPGTYSLPDNPSPQNQPYPSQPARIAADAWLRSQRILHLQLFPFQVSAAGDRIRHTATLRVIIQLNSTPIASCGATCAAPDPFETVLQKTLLNAAAARAWRANPAQALAGTSKNGPSHQPAAISFLGPRYRVVVQEDGLYKLTYSDLDNAGVELANTDPRNFRLVNQGREIAIQVTGEADGRFDPGDQIIFYGEQFQGDVLAAQYASIMTNPIPVLPGNNWLWQCQATCELSGLFERYTRDNIYWLLTDGPDLPRIDAPTAVIDGTPGSAPIPSYYTATVQVEEAHAWWSHDFTSEDVWFWDEIKKSVIYELPITRTYPITLTAVAPAATSARVHAELASRASSSGTPDHHTQFYFNTLPAPIDDSYWDGITRHAFDAQIPQSSLQEGLNQLHLTLLPDVAPEMSATRMYFDWFSVAYARSFTAENDVLNFSYAIPGTWRYRVNGFSGNADAAVVMDITNPLQPRLVSNAAVTGDSVRTIHFQTSSTLPSRYVVSTSAALRAPAAPVTAYTPPDFMVMPPADYLFITHAAFADTLQPLVDYRTTQGLSTTVIDIADLYNEFNHGIYHPIAIKNFLLYAFENWDIPPTYVTLVGSGHWNLMAYPEYPAPPIYMPPNLAYVDPWQGEVDSANLLATVVGDDPLPDLIIARIPVSTTEELAGIIRKTIAFERTPPQDWQRRILFITDNTPDPAGDFPALAQTIVQDYLDPNPTYTADFIPLDDYDAGGSGICTKASDLTGCAQVTQHITQTINITGTLLLNYIGHASVDRWTHERIFAVEDIPSLHNQDRLPVLLSLTCLDGYWIHPELTSLSVKMLTHPTGGAAATFSATGLGVATGHDVLQRGFFEAVFNQGPTTIGTAALSAKQALYLTGRNQDLMHTFVIFGDPALRFPHPGWLSHRIYLPLTNRP